MFNRKATYPVCDQLSSVPGECGDDETVAEIVDVSADGMTVAYSDGKQNAVGFVDITDAANPTGLGLVDVGGETTSVAFINEYVVAGVNTSPDYVNPSGELKVIASGAIVATIDLDGQPDSVAVSLDNKYIAVAIENERNEDLGDGSPPQMPAGFLKVIDTSDPDPTTWSAATVQLTDLPGCDFPEDPEPEYVSINAQNEAVITLQENNCLAIVDLAALTVTASYTAGMLSLDKIDTVEEDVIDQTSSLDNVKREPDAVAWIDDEYFVTADEGDLDGGSRSFTIFKKDGTVTYTSGNELEILAARLGHYPEHRSENKGTEPEGVTVATFGGKTFIFVLLERANLCAVYEIVGGDVSAPVYKQALPTGVGPEGVVAVPARNLLVVASEKDARGDNIRASVATYALEAAEAQYPTLESVDGSNGVPIPWSALSGLANGGGTTLYSVEDSAYRKSRIFTIDVATHKPALLTAALRIKDTNGVFAAIAVEGDGDDNDVFSAADLAAMINGDGTVNLDLEGITVDGTSLVVASEGRGTVGDAGRPVESLNFLFKVARATGVIQEVITLPPAVNAMQLRFGFHGVTICDDGNYYVAFQRAWGGEADPRIGKYDPLAKTWTFVFFPLDAPESPNGGWVGLSDITFVGDGKFLVLERDNQFGPDARIKRIYEFSTSAWAADPTITVEKTLVKDLVPYLEAPGGLLYEKIEGMAVMDDGNVYVCNDNDGVDDNSGETQLLNVEGIL